MTNFSNKEFNSKVAKNLIEKSLLKKCVFVKKIMYFIEYGAKILEKGQKLGAQYTRKVSHARSISQKILYKNTMASLLVNALCSINSGILVIGSSPRFL